MEKNKLTNRDISENYRDYEVWLFPHDLTAAFAYCVVSQNEADTITLDKPLEAFRKYIEPLFPEPKLPTKFSYERLSGIIDRKAFEKIPEMVFLGEKPHSIDFSALGRNIFYDVLRERITSGLIDKKVTENIIASE